MTECQIARVGGPVPLVGDPEEGPWPEATPVAVDRHPWAGSEAVADEYPIAATARLLSDERALYLQYRVTDGHQQATTTERNGEVWTDSCVELFADPAPDEGGGYLNFEANCVGQFRMGFGPGRGSRELVPPGPAEAVRVETSVPGPRTDPDPATDETWWLAAALPFDALASFTGVEIDPRPGDVWRANLQCCREGAAPSFAVWSPVEAPAPDFHRPAQFGRLAFD